MHTHLRTACITFHITIAFAGIAAAQQSPPPKARDVAAPLSLKVSNLLRYVDEPVAGFEQTDIITSAALVLSF